MTERTGGKDSSDARDHRTDGQANGVHEHSVGHHVRQYRIERRLGGGAMGVVYSAWDTRLDRRVALKFMPRHLSVEPLSKDRFLVEARAAARIDHPNICQVYEIAEAENGRLYIAMGFYQGETLKAKLTFGALELSEALDYTIQVATGISAAHAHGILHRDIKPANVLVTEDGVCKVLDFGVAKRQEEDVTLTEVGESIGTLAYMSPEQLEGTPVDQRTDIWSLGVLAYEMLTGRRPFAAERVPAVMHAIVSSTPPAPSEINPDIPPELDEIIMRALSKDPAERPESMADFARELLVLSGGTSPTDLHSGVHPSLGGGRRSSRLAWGAVAGVAVLAGALGLWRASSGGAPPDSAIAVLPFGSLSADQEDVSFTDGLHGEVIVRLTRIGGLRVISPGSVLPYRDYVARGMTVDEVARELDVSLVLEGTVQRFEDDLKISVFLTDTESGDTRWSDVIERQRSELFSIQREVSEEVARALNVTLSMQEQALLAAGATENYEAYEFYLTGRGFEQGRNEADLTEALGFYQRAVQEDDDFALAHLRLGYVHVRLYWFGYDRSADRLARARAAIDRAFQIEPDLAEGHLVRAWYLYQGERNYEGALESLAIAERDLAGEPEVVRIRGAIERRRGNFQEAIGHLTQAFELDPRNPGLAFDIANTHQALGDYDEAEGWFDLALDIEPTGSRYWRKAWNNILRDGNADVAREIMLEADGVIDPATWPERTRHWTWVEFLSGDPGRALDWALREPDAWIRVSQYGDMPTDLLIGEAHFRLDDLEGAQRHFAMARDSLLRKREDFDACDECPATTEEAFVHRNLGIVYARLGDLTQAEIHGIEARDLINSVGDALISPDFNLDLAIIYMASGNQVAAIGYLEYVLGRPGQRATSRAVLRSSPLWDPLRENPAFSALLEGG